MVEVNIKSRNRNRLIINPDLTMSTKSINKEKKLTLTMPKMWRFRIKKQITDGQLIPDEKELEKNLFEEMKSELVQAGKWADDLEVVRQNLVDEQKTGVFLKSFYHEVVKPLIQKLIKYLKEIK